MSEILWHVLPAHLLECVVAPYIIVIIIIIFKIYVK